MKRFAILLPVVILLAACSAATTPSIKTGSTPTHVSSPVVVYGTVGKPVTMGQWAISLQSVKLIDPTTIAQHDQIFPSVTSDQRFLLLNEHIQNVSTVSANIAGGEFSLQDTKGNADFSTMIGVPGVNALGLGGTLAPSMQQVGQEVYVVPASTHDFFWIYTAKDNLRQIIWRFTI